MDDDDSDVVFVENRSAQPSSSNSTPLDALEIELQSACAVLTSFAQDVIQFSYDSQNGLFDRVNEFVTCLKKVDDKCKAVDAVIPFDVLEAIDKGRNPEHVTLSLLESCEESNNISRGKVTVMRQFKQNLENAMRDTPQHTSQPNGNDSQPSTNPGMRGVMGQISLVDGEEKGSTWGFVGHARGGKCAPVGESGMLQVGGGTGR
ncbi:unnamed protein product [Agarophyton chilense]